MEGYVENQGLAARRRATRCTLSFASMMPLPARRLGMELRPWHPRRPLRSVRSSRRIMINGLARRRTGRPVANRRRSSVSQSRHPSEHRYKTKTFIAFELSGGVLLKTPMTDQAMKVYQFTVRHGDIRYDRWRVCRYPLGTRQQEWTPWRNSTHSKILSSNSNTQLPFPNNTPLRSWPKSTPQTLPPALGHRYSSYRKGYAAA